MFYSHMKQLKKKQKSFRLLKDSLFFETANPLTTIDIIYKRNRLLKETNCL